MALGFSCIDELRRSTLCCDNEQPSHFIRHECRRADLPMLVESTNEGGEVVIRRTRRHERVDLCEDADGDGSDDKDAAADEDL